MAVISSHQVWLLCDSPSQLIKQCDLIIKFHVSEQITWPIAIAQWVKHLYDLPHGFSGILWYTMVYCKRTATFCHVLLQASSSFGTPSPSSSWSCQKDSDGVMWIKQKWTTHLGMVCTSYKNGDNWGMVHYCFTHIIWCLCVYVVSPSDPRATQLKHPDSYNDCSQSHPCHLYIAFSSGPEVLR